MSASILFQRTNRLVTPNFSGGKAPGGLVWPATDADLQALTGYATSATSLYVFDNAAMSGMENDLISSNDVTLSGGGIAQGVSDSSFSLGCVQSTDNSTGTAAAGNVFNGDSSVAVLFVFKTTAVPGGNRTIFGKSNGALSGYWECRIDNSNRLRGIATDGTSTGVANTTSTSHTDGTLTTALLKIDSTANTMDLWTSNGNATQVDISAVVSMNNSVNFEPINGRLNNPPIRIGLMAVYTGAAAEGITATAQTNLHSNQNLPA